MKARFGGYCPRCHKRYPAGTMIEKQDGAWGHVNCRAPIPDTAPVRAVNVQAMLPADDATEAADWNVHVDPPYVEKPYSPSRYQLAVNSEVSDGSGNLVVTAGPGSGKTTTIVHALDLTPQDADVAFVAFNRHIAKELERRAPARVHVSTLHSLGLSAFRRFNPRVRVDDDKLSRILGEWYPTAAQDEPDRAQRSVNRRKKAMMRRVISIAKAIMVDASDATAVADMVDRYGVEVDLDVLDELIRILPEAMERCQADTDVIDFDDMIWLPLVLEMPVKQFDFLFVDEAQDLNRSQMMFIRRSLRDGGRIIAVGDPNQSLYAFRGADAEAIPNLIAELNAKVLPLSITYRCPLLHIDKLNEIIPGQVEPAPNAKKGVIGEVDEHQLVQMLEAGDMVLCRTNAPLIDPAFACVRAGKKAIIRGRDIGKSLVDLVDRFETEDLVALDASLGEYYEREYNRYLDAGKELQADLVKDKVETIRSVMGECATGRVSELRDKIERLFSDDNIGIVFSSVHRAKGLEAERVFILHEELMPHPRAKKPWELAQERNCMFVAFSRSKSELYIVR